jgi:hypothetical protein
MSLLDAMRAEASLIADFKLSEVLAIVKRNRAQGRIWQLRRRKAYPRDEVESQYMMVLNRYVHHKVMHKRIRFEQHHDTMATQYRDEMERLEALINGEIAKWSNDVGFLFSGHFSQ